ncbi:hypothetical protein HYV69_01705 [Candidatus Uhrbacteria bacterium]|nr:hypothetical protein [Candidatus Uhrbacteria bacterium]
MLEAALTVIGWLFVLGPTLAFVCVSFYVIKGAMGDDVVVNALVLIGLAFFFMGSILLLILYLTNLFG